MIYLKTLVICSDFREPISKRIR